MTMRSTASRLLGGVSITALTIAAAQPAAAQGRYAAGDFHNHTICSDGSISQITSLKQALVTFNLDWFINTDHGGDTTRDCRFDNPSYTVGTPGDPAQFYQDTIARGDYPGESFKGDPLTDNGYAPKGHAPVQAMWRWQNLKEFQYPLQVATHATVAPNKTVMMGYEQIVPGHEHSEVIVLNGQYPKRGVGNDNPLAEFEFRYDRADGDTTGPVDAAGNKIWTGKTFSNDGNAGHQKALAGIRWEQANYPTTSYNIPAHLERAGPFNPTGSNGYDINHLRDYNNAGPTVSFGFESEPGHQPSGGRGGYGTGAVGGGTYGGVGYYAVKVGGVWDALLGEGRNWWFFASSDWHNRGNFSPYVPQTTGDWYPGEFQKDWTFIPGDLNKQTVVDSLRAGNSFSVMGDMITNDLSFTASAAGQTATMGQTLVVPPGSDVTVTLTFTQSSTPNHSPYSFPNPILTSIGITQPLNQPQVDHVDLITGKVTGVVDPSSPTYAGSISKTGVESNPAATTNSTTAIAGTFGSGSWTVSGQKRTITYTIPAVTGPMYVRARGTNLPAAIPNATDANGNPLIDSLNVNIPCVDAACPAHVAGKVNYDVRGWSNLWVYLNPIYIRPSTSAPLLAETNAALLKQLAGTP